MSDHNPKPELLFFAFFTLAVIVFLPQAAPALLMQVLQVIADNTWPMVILLLGLAVIKAIVEIFKGKPK